MGWMTVSPMRVTFRVKTSYLECQNHIMREQIIPCVIGIVS